MDEFYLITKVFSHVTREAILGVYYTEKYARKMFEQFKADLKGSPEEYTFIVKLFKVVHTTPDKLLEYNDAGNFEQLYDEMANLEFDSKLATRLDRFIVTGRV